MQRRLRILSSLSFCVRTPLGGLSFFYFYHRFRFPSSLFSTFCQSALCILPLDEGANGDVRKLGNRPASTRGCNLLRRRGLPSIFCLPTRGLSRLTFRGKGVLLSSSMARGVAYWIFDNCLISARLNRELPSRPPISHGFRSDVLRRPDVRRQSEWLVWDSRTPLLCI